MAVFVQPVVIILKGIKIPVVLLASVITLKGINTLGG